MDPASTTTSPAVSPTAQQPEPPAGQDTPNTSIKPWTMVCAQVLPPSVVPSTTAAHPPDVKVGPMARQSLAEAQDTLESRVCARPDTDTWLVQVAPPSVVATTLGSLTPQQ